MANISSRNRPRGTASCGHLSWLLNFFTLAIPLALFYKSFNMTDANLCYVFAVVWSADTAGLLVGQYLKGPLLTEWSPKKTVSGLYGALILGTLAGTAWQLKYFADSLSILRLMQIVGMSLKLAVSSQIGDFLESVCKRHCGLKDSNYLFRIPGHGGILDRIDGLIISIIMY